MEHSFTFNNHVILSSFPVEMATNLLWNCCNMDAIGMVTYDCSMANSNNWIGSGMSNCFAPSRFCNAKIAGVFSKL